MIDLGFRIDRGDTKNSLFRALQECGLGRNAVENLIQDVANQDVIRKRRTENGNQRLYDRSNDEEVNTAAPQTPPPPPQQQQLQRRSIAVGQRGRRGGADANTNNGTTRRAPRAFGHARRCLAVASSSGGAVASFYF
jgi:hypothetical protein